MPEGERESDERKNRGEAGRGEVETKDFLDSRSHRSTLFLSPSHTKKSKQTRIRPFPSRAKSLRHSLRPLYTNAQHYGQGQHCCCCWAVVGVDGKLFPPTLLLCFRRSFRRSCLASPGRPHRLRHGTHFPLSLAARRLFAKSRLWAWSQDPQGRRRERRR